MADLTVAIAQVRSLVERGGPFPHDYPAFDSLLDSLLEAKLSGDLAPTDLVRFRESFGDTLTSAATLQGLALTKPHGYPGDFEILDKVYRHHVSDDPRLRGWDVYFQQIAAAQAVRNRKAYFHRLVEKVSISDPAPAVLEIGAGSGRPYREWFESHPDSRVRFDAVEIDPNAVEYAQRLNFEYVDAIWFFRVNPRRFAPERKYHLVWSAGFFDYCEDAVFVRLLRRLSDGLLPEGELVVGNFSPKNTSRAYMELVGDWHLIYRTEAELLALARSALPKCAARVEAEEEGVNLFLRLNPQLGG